MSIDKYQVDLDLITVNSEVNGSSKAKMHLGVTDINHCQYKHRGHLKAGMREHKNRLAS